jgi:nucleoside-diphosphate-sugar epimerase
MRTVLLTGSSGGVGRVVGPVLADAGWDVQPFDLAQGSDLRDPRSVAAATRGMSKRLAEEMCEAWTRRTRIPTIVLRPVLILSDQNLPAYSPDTAELGAFVHVDDVAGATRP